MSCPRGIDQSPRSWTYTLFLPQGVKIEFILVFTLRAAFSEIQTEFQNWHIWAWNLTIGKSSRSAHILSFYPSLLKLTLIIFAAKAMVKEIQANFQNCHIWAWNLAIGQSSRRVKIDLIFALWAVVSEIKLSYLGMQLGHWQKIQKLHRILPMGSKLSLFSVYGQRFPRYRPNLKIAMFWHETWPLAKVPENCTANLFFIPQAEPIFALQATVKQREQFLTLIMLIR